MKLFARKPSEFILRSKSKICLKMSSSFFTQWKDKTLFYVTLNTVLGGI